MPRTHVWAVLFICPQLRVERVLWFHFPITKCAFSEKAKENLCFEAQEPPRRRRRKCLLFSRGPGNLVPWSPAPESDQHCRGGTCVSQPSVHPGNCSTFVPSSQRLLPEPPADFLALPWTRAKDVAAGWGCRAVGAQDGGGTGLVFIRLLKGILFPLGTFSGQENYLHSFQRERNKIREPGNYCPEGIVVC